MIKYHLFTGLNTVKIKVWTPTIYVTQRVRDSVVAKAKLS